MIFDTKTLSFQANSQVLARLDGTTSGEVQVPGGPAERGSDFRAVEGGGETMNGGALLVEAYAVLWVILFGFIWLSWRRQVRIDARVAELERSLAAVPRSRVQ